MSENRRKKKSKQSQKQLKAASSRGLKEAGTFSKPKAKSGNMNPLVSKHGTATRDFKSSLSLKLAPLSGWHSVGLISPKEQEKPQEQDLYNSNTELACRLPHTVPA